MRGWGLPVKVSIPSSSGLRLDYLLCDIVYKYLSSQSLLHQVCGWILPLVLEGCSGWPQSLLHQVCGWITPGANIYQSLLSQSLLHQVCGWITRIGDADIPHCVSIPSSSGLRLDYSSGRDWRCQSVSIPSSSGLRLDFFDTFSLAHNIRLNPFFIRSAVGFYNAPRTPTSSGSQSLLHQVCGWITWSCASTATGCRLNPFFIRSAVGLGLRRQERHGGRVSIPSSSGLRLDCYGGAPMALTDRLNPFFIRSAVGFHGGL